MDRRAVLAAAAALACAGLLGACSAPDPDRIAREREAAEAIDKAAARLYKRPFDVIWGALMASAAERRMTVVQADAGSGVIELRHGATSTSAGERIDIRVTGTVEQAVRVEIRSQPLVAVSLPRDWQRVLFGDLEQKIAPRRQP
ncbi:MAG: hypothetical protein ING77_17155 [Rhodocyclaceae bacterium]|jgi:hypothetical protein|nr:hypothetical protein [Rhodocyclaceae bacterium]MCE2979269.1 hypothetical protein [Betaproteobacteria bacterium]MCA3073910.1 hypothetical protein [Rhodocyclaceae bacterium]MCA3089281.1 hypothetical protein [Rhodocyclaceae bacterium]MCA3092842.1 hypothetical protein [Rhodocyclaceae bacterium]